jgi:deoxyribonuclease-4
MLLLGAHISIGAGFSAAANKIGGDYRCNVMQIFTKSPQGGQVKAINAEDAARFRELRDRYGIRAVIAHSSYLLNLAKPLESVPWMENNILQDFERLAVLGGDGVIVHIGKALASDRDAAIHTVIENAKRIINATAKLTSASGRPLEYILENTAGQGSEIGYLFEELSLIWKGLRGFSPRLRVCLDTAHAWGAGYDLGTKKGALETLRLYDQTVGLETLACFHFNDSKKNRGSRVDRHDNIGSGLIGLAGLTEIAKYAKLKSIPLILETPEQSGTERLEDIKKVRAMVDESA